MQMDDDNDDDDDDDYDDDDDDDLDVHNDFTGGCFGWSVWRWKINSSTTHRKILLSG